MVGIERLEDFAVAVVAQCDTLKSYEVVSTSAELKDVMDSVREWPLLVVVIPSAKGNDRNRDARAELNIIMFFVLRPMRESMTREQRMDLWKETQQGMLELKEFIHESRCGEFDDLFSRMKFEDRVQEPEYNVIDCSGWSLAFEFETGGM